MKLQMIIDKTQADEICNNSPNREIEMICASDLMSDILTLEPEDAILVTGLANIQAIRTAEMADIDTILFVREKEITKDMISLAEESEITLLETKMGMYEVCGLLYEMGIKPAFTP